MNLVTPKAAAQPELLFNKPVSRDSLSGASYCDPLPTLPTGSSLGWMRHPVRNTLTYSDKIYDSKKYKVQAIGTCTVKLFTAVNIAVVFQTSVLITVSYFHPSLIFASKVGAYLSGASRKTVL